MRRSLILGVASALDVVAAVVVVQRPTRDRSSDPLAAGSPVTEQAPGLAPRFAQAGDVLVSIEPVRVDRTGAVFRVGFETHSVDLSLDVANASGLEVDAKPWGNPTWSGSAPGGHHRDGVLSFDANGRARGDVVLTIGGLAQPVVASWTIG
jgi:hypothetical protein